MKIIEATAREVMTRREQLLKKKLIALLRDDGKGHKHAKYAERLEDFIVKIVDSNEDPEMTAAVSFEEVTIYISDGFLKDPETFYQLNVLMRHELAHYLMQHQIRMMHKIIEKYGEDGYTRIKMSQSLHRLMNIIEDFEISNTRYSEADKIVVRNMMLNCRLIGGLVTDDIRDGWKNLSVTDMFDMLEAETEGLRRAILARWDTLDLNEIGTQNDFVHDNVKYNSYFYNDIKSPTNFLGPIEKYLKNQALYHFFVFDRQTARGTIPCLIKFSNLPEPYQNIIKDLHKVITENLTDMNGTVGTQFFTKAEVKTMISEIAKSSPLSVHKVTRPNFSDHLVTLYTPEEKLVAIDTLKAMLSTLEHYQTWYDKVTRVLSDSKFSKEDLEKILAAISK